MLLAGPIRLAGQVVGYAARETPVEAAWRPETIVLEYDSGTRTEVRKRYRLHGRFGMRGLTGVQLADFRYKTSNPFVITLRTRGPEEDLEELFTEVDVMVYRTNDIEEASTLVARRGSDGEHIFETVLEFESVAVIDRIPPAIDGGFSYEGDSSIGDYACVDILPYGKAYAYEQVVTRTFLNQEYEFTLVQLGPGVLMSFVSGPDPDEEYPFSMLLMLDGTMNLWGRLVEDEEASTDQVQVLRREDARLANLEQSLIVDARPLPDGRIEFFTNLYKSRM